MINFNVFVGKIEKSFTAALKGEEQVKNLIYYWGISSYLFFYFVVEKTIKSVDLKFIDISLSAIAIIYFAWHVYVLRKCSPKKPKISKEEKKRLRKEAWRNAPRSFMRKLLLQEPISKWNPALVTTVADLLFLLHFLGYIL